MLDAKDLKRFIDLPPIFNKAILADIEQALDEYDAFNAYAMDMLDFYRDLDERNLYIFEYQDEVKQ